MISRSIILKQFIFQIFRKFAKIFSGSGLRNRYEFINTIYQLFNRGLSPVTAEVHGHIMYLDNDDSMGLSITKEYEPLETQLLIDNIKTGDVVLDVGANIGYFTLLFAKLVGKNGHVFAFEPDPYSYQLLIKNIRVNKYKNISAYQLGLSDENSILYLARDQFNNLDHRVLKSAQSDDTVEIEVKILDDFYPTISNRNIDFVKMDIQGSEGWALEGMKNLISDSKGLSILTEYWPLGLHQNGYGGINYILQLKTLGFDLFDVGDGENNIVSITVDEILVKYPDDYSGHTNILCQRK